MYDDQDHTHWSGPLKREVIQYLETPLRSLLHLLVPCAREQVMVGNYDHTGLSHRRPTPLNGKCHITTKTVGIRTLTSHVQVCWIPRR
jgi:hypothetical protein